MLNTGFFLRKTKEKRISFDYLKTEIPLGHVKPNLFPMHPYVRHLLEDIRNAEREKTILDCAPATLEEEFELIERYVRGENEQPLSYFTGLKKQHFPPGEQLSEKNMILVLDAFDKLMLTWNAKINFPENMPVEKRYEFLRSHILEKPFSPLNFGTVYLSFCSGNVPDCEWDNFCGCR